MRKIRIGNDVDVRWEVETGGEQVSLEGRQLRLWVRSAYARQEITEFSVDGCVLSFRYEAAQQKTTGARAVELTDATEGSATRTICADEAFTLVAHTCEESETEEDFDKYIVSLKSNILVGLPGLSAYDLWLKDGHTGTTEDYMKWLQQPAEDAASAVMEAEKARKTAEEARKSAELQRDEAEAERNTNESARKTAEQQRQASFAEKMTALSDKEEEVDTAISEMQTEVNDSLAAVTATDNAVKAAEASRAEAEEDRRKAENARQTAEKERDTEEDSRSAAETSRTANETARATAEEQRAKSETLRNADESTRKTAESARISNESSRTANESARQASETARKEAETARAEAEKARQTAEAQREATFEEKAAAADAAVNRCETATEGAEKVNVELSGNNELTVTDKDGNSKSIELASQEDVVGIVDDVRHLDETMGAYTEREDITLTATETNKAISADGVKISKQGWAIAEFTAEKGNVYLFNPGVTDGGVCIFAEKIESIETRGIDYTYTYNEDGTISTATATYLGKTHVYTYMWATDAQGNKAATITEDGADVQALPLTYETQVGTYAPLVRLNADAELPKDGYCRYMSHFKGNSAIKIAVSYKTGSADLVMKVTRDGVLASISTQLGNLSQKEDETRNKMEEYHRSWVDVKFSTVGDNYFINIDDRRIVPDAMKKLRYYPKYRLGWGRQDAWHSATATKILFDVSHLDTSNITDMSNMFSDCGSLTSIDVSGFDTSKVTNMSAMFSSCNSLTSIDVSGFDTSKVTNMSAMFSGCGSLTSIDVSGFDTSKVTNMSSMFSSCGSLTSIDVSGFDTSKVTNMSSMFTRCFALVKIILDIDTSSVTNATNFTGDPFSGTSVKTILLGADFFRMPLTAFSFAPNSNWTDSSVRQSLVTNSYDRRANGLDDLTLTLHANTKKVLTADDIAVMTAKGYIIA